MSCVTSRRLDYFAISAVEIISLFEKEGYESI